MLTKQAKRFAERLEDKAFENAFVEKQNRENVPNDVRDAYTQNTINLYAELAEALSESKFVVIGLVAKLITNNMCLNGFSENLYRISNFYPDDLAYATKHDVFDFEKLKETHADVFKHLELNFDLVAETIIDMQLSMFDDEYIIDRLTELGGIVTCECDMLDEYKSFFCK